MARSPGKSGAGVSGKKVSGVFTLIFIYIYKVNNGQFRLMPKRCFEDTTMIRTNFA